jgi:uncharacterized protein
MEGTSRRIKGEVGMIRTNNGILVSAELDFGVELTCSRCLCEYTCPLHVKIEEVYKPTINIVSGAPLPKEEADTFTINERQIIDLAEAIRQYGVLATPMKPLCKEECAGLCETCGKNLNQGSCNCAPRDMDPRWAKLKQLCS